MHDPTPYSELMNSMISRFSVQEVIQAAVNLVEFLPSLPFAVPTHGLECAEIKVRVGKSADFLKVLVVTIGFKQRGFPIS